ncbi:hypothetical protein [Shewanella maritima]|uniref:hypothetical protein n=1 Tax=Shewanella maritima TaxID=2520507 RepID=UPI003734F0DE
MKISGIFLFVLFISNTVLAAPIITSSAPSLTGSKQGSLVHLEWQPACGANQNQFNIQESVNGINWYTVYSGAGDSGGGYSPYSSQLQLQSSSTSVTPDFNGPSDCIHVYDPKTTVLSGKVNPQYYYRIRGCYLSNCSQYGQSILVSEQLSPPGNLTLEKNEETVILSWSSVSGAEKYKLQAKKGNENFKNIYNGTSTSTEYSVDLSTYQFRVAACRVINFSTECSSYTSPIILPGYVQMTYEYDALGRLHIIKKDSVTEKTFNYDPAGNRTSVEKN